ncbi:MAG: hypothetical protein P4M11_05665 [Candidatus Pacebacteria bacterium]|nr:hypothetical protein [Candidatus Paceibacterota bacterium]
MGLDATSLGIQIVFILVIPGFVFFAVFRWIAGFHDKVGEFASFCAALIFGLIVLGVWEWSKKGNTTAITQILSNPFQACAALIGAAFILALLVGLPTGWIRSKLRL